MGKLLDRNVPIYVQIMDEVKHSIVSGELKLGDRVKSVREMAGDFGVNPNTIQRALLELEREGLVATERTQGRYVAANQDTIDELRLAMAKEATERFFEEMKALGFTTGEIREFSEGHSQKEVNFRNEDT